METSTSPRRSGRPRKFAGPSRVITLTLPETTLAQLARLDGDRARAIVCATEKATETATGKPAEPGPGPAETAAARLRETGLAGIRAAGPAELSPAGVALIEVSPGVGMITVPACPALAGIPGLSLVRVSPGRFLLVATEGTPVAALEIALTDQIEQLPPQRPDEAAVLVELLGHLRAARRTGRVTLGAVLLVDIP